MRKFRVAGYIAWSIGLFVVLYLAGKVTTAISNYQANTFHGNPLWYLPVFMIVGIYVGILFVKKWSFHVNWWKLVVCFVPLVLFNPEFDAGTTLPLLFIFRNFPLDVITGILSGIVLITSLFE